MHEEHRVAHANGVWLACFVHGYTSTSLADEFCPRHWYLEMTIKELIETGKPFDETLSKYRLQSDDTINEAFKLFIKLNAVLLPVYDDNQFQGTVSLTALAKKIMAEYTAEREKRYRLIKQLNHSVTKVISLIDKVSHSSRPDTRNQFIGESLKILYCIKDLIK